MHGAVLIRGARQLITLQGPAGPRRGLAMRDVHIIQDGAILISDGIIQEVGPSRRVERLKACHDALEIDATGKCVVPAFVDPYARLLCGPARRNEDGAPAPGAFQASVCAFRQYSPQRMDLELAKRLRPFIHHGTTTIGACCGYGLDQAAEIKALRVLKARNNQPLRIEPSFFGGAACPAEYEGNPEGYAAWLEQAPLAEIKQKRLTRRVSAHSSLGERALGRLFPAARQTDFDLQFHTSGEFVPLALQHGADTLVGLESAGPETVAAVAASNAIAVLTPGECFVRGDDYAPARALIDAGAAVALATGFDLMMSPTASMPMIMSLACARMKMTPAEAIVAATVNAASALGVDSEVGVLQHAKHADLLLLQTGDYRDLVFHFGLNLVAVVFRKGEQIYPRMGAARR